MLTLIRPSIEFKESFLAGLAEFQKEGLSWWMERDALAISQDFADFVAKENSKMTLWSKAPPVHESVYWAILGGEFVGVISIRHELNEDLRIMGGHIGYDTRPSFRGRGVASEMLRQALPIARSLGIKEALLTCSDTNAPSIRVIEKNGGQLRERKLQYSGGHMKRYYWIKL